VAVRVVTVCNALGSSSNYCAGRFLVGSPFGVYCRGEQISPDDSRPHVALVGGQKSVVLQLFCEGIEEKIEQQEASTLIRLIMPSEGSRCGYSIPLVDLFPGTIDDLVALTAGHNSEATTPCSTQRINGTRVRESVCLTIPGIFAVHIKVLHRGSSA
jgi:hypothetical protein